MIYNIDDLKKAYNEGKKSKFVFFWGHTPSRTGVSTKAALVNGGCVHLQ